MKNSKRTGFKLRHRRLVCENGKFNVFFDYIQQSRGQDIPDFLVVAPKQKYRGLVTGVAVLPIIDQKIGLIRIYRHPIRAYSWEIPRGFIDAGESPVFSAMRELNEETGLNCTLKNMRSLGWVTPETGILAAKVHLFAGSKCLASAPFNPDEMGHKEFYYFSRSELASMAARSIIQDPCTLVAFYRWNQIQK